MMETMLMNFEFKKYRIAVHPQSKGYSIGGEDGYVRVHHFDDDFFTAKPC